MTSRPIASLAVASLLAILPVLAGCATSRGAEVDLLEGRVHEASALRLGPRGAVPRWEVVPGTNAVLAGWRHVSGPRESGVNEEVVFELDPAALAVGSHDLSTSARKAHYQRGGQILTYESGHVGGTLTVSVATEERLEGTLDLSMTAPDLDLQGVGTLSRALRFRAIRTR